jgi:hypothetical protein
MAMANLKSLSKSTPAQSGSVTLRFDGDMLDDLRKESEHKRISLNTLATQIFRTHREYGSMSARAGMVSFHKSLLIRLMDKLSEDEITKLSEYIAKNELKDTILLMKKRYDASAFVDFIEAWARVSGFEYRHDVSDRTHSFVIQHDMGKRWSAYIANIFKYGFYDVGAKWADFQTTDNTVTFNVEV